MTGSRRLFRADLADIAGWPVRRWVAGLLGGVLFAVAAGAPTDVLPNPVFGRQLGVEWWSYPLLAATSVLAGLVFATYVRSPAPVRGVATTAGGGLLSALAIGCPVCNKLVIVLLGTSGALSVWAPLQPLLGLISLALLGWALRARLKAERSCPRPTSGAAAQQS